MVWKHGGIEMWEFYILLFVKTFKTLCTLSNHPFKLCVIGVKNINQMPCKIFCDTALFSPSVEVCT